MSIRSRTSSRRSRRPRKVPLQLQTYYHGTLPRSETNKFLVKAGDFLVRVSSRDNQDAQIIISMLHTDDRILHFALNKDHKGYSLQGDKFTHVHDLIQHYRRTKTPLTAETGAIIRRPRERASWQMSQHDIEIHKQIGSGHYAIVYSGKVRLAQDEWIPAAIKKPTTLTITSKEKEDFLAEAHMLLRFNHPNIVKMYGVCADHQRLLILMELCPGGNLLTSLKTGTTPLDDRMSYCYDAALGIRYLHTKEIIHRDLAARNCLLGTNGDLKISDFGLSKEGSYNLTQGTEITLPTRWTAPEALTQGRFSKKSDVFSFAVLVWEIFNDGKQPWSELKNASEVIKALEKGERLKFPANTPRSIITLAETCFTTSPNERPSFDEICTKLNSIICRSEISRTPSISTYSNGEKIASKLKQ